MQKHKIKKTLNDQIQFIFKMKKNEARRNASNSDEEREKVKKGRSPSPDGGSKWGGSSISKGTGAPSMLGGKSTLSVFQGTGHDVNPLEDLGHPRLNEQLIPLRDQRTKLEEKKG